jgi:hypothetical protein
MTGFFARAFSDKISQFMAGSTARQFTLPHGRGSDDSIVNSRPDASMFAYGIPLKIAYTYIVFVIYCLVNLTTLMRLKCL